MLNVDKLIVAVTASESRGVSGLLMSRAQQLAASSALPMVASRKAVIEKFDRLLSLQQQSLQHPMRDSAGVDVAAEAFERENAAMIDSKWEMIRFLPVVEFCPSVVSRFKLTAEHILGRKEGTLIGIALELYHRHTGHYPQQLDELAPTYLPSLPVDRITGGPLHYRLIDGKPIVYSVGGDRKDDGGRLPIVKGVPDAWAAVYWDHSTDGPAGDWVIFGEPAKNP